MQGTLDATFDNVKLLLNDGEKIYSDIIGCIGEVISVSEPDSKGNGLFGFEVCSKSRPHDPVKRHQHIHGFVPTKMREYSLTLDNSGNYRLGRPL